MTSNIICTNIYPKSEMISNGMRILVTKTYYSIGIIIHISNEMLEMMMVKERRDVRRGVGKIWEVDGLYMF